MMEIYYAGTVLVMLIVSIVYLTRSKEPNIYSAFSVCPHCGARMKKTAGVNNHFEQICPSCTCCSDEFGNNL